MQSGRKLKYVKNEETSLVFCDQCKDWFPEEHFYTRLRPNNKMTYRCKFSLSEYEKKPPKKGKKNKIIRNLPQEDGTIYCGHCENYFDNSHFNTFIYNNKKDRWGKINPNPIVQYTCRLHDKRYAINREVNKYNSNFFHDSELYRKDVELQREYGITLDTFNELLIQQNYSCAICSKPHNECLKGLFVDHCHKTNEVRALLCNTCNSGIGLFKDKSELLRLAANYLEKYNKDNI